MPTTFQLEMSVPPLGFQTFLPRPASLAVFPGFQTFLPRPASLAVFQDGPEIGKKIVQISGVL